VPDLASSLLSSVSQRLQQAEKLLSVSGRRRVQDRLYHFLLLLKQEVGQPVSNGTRIQARLTHEDLANACCTTRVTVTRILGKLQQQGKITLDSKHHIIVHDDRL
jgi:CRP-like cAMP-binding protein